MGFSKVCRVDEIGAAGMDAFFLDGWEVLVVRDKHGDLHAMNGTCPHEDFPLVHGDFDGEILTCANHAWRFDAITGKGISAPACTLSKYAIKVENGDVFVDMTSEPS